MLVERHWRVKVTDFNLSRMVHTGEQNASVTSLLANNPRWLAPEVSFCACWLSSPLLLPACCRYSLSLQLLTLHAIALKCMSQCIAKQVTATMSCLHQT